MRVKLVLVCICLTLASLSACNKKVSEASRQEVVAPEGETKILTLDGILTLKPWAKSGQSYCAQGGSYYVLAANDSETVLEFTSEKQRETLTKGLNGKSVTIKGHTRSKTIKAVENELSQRPIGVDGKPEDYTCEVFVVKNILANQ